MDFSALTALALFAAWMLFVLTRSSLIPYVTPLYWINAAMTMLSAAYLDSNPNTFTTELLREIGGGYSAWLYLATVMAATLGIIITLNARAVERLGATDPDPQASELIGPNLPYVVIGLGVLLVALYAELVVIGDIPLFSGTDRSVYAQQIAGPVHTIYRRIDAPLFFVIGALVYWCLVHDDKQANVLLTIAMGFFAYYVFVGHRFSTPSAVLACLIVPVGLAAARSRRTGTGGLFALVAQNRVAIGLAVMLVGSYSIANTQLLDNIRGLSQEEASEYQVHRVFVLQAQQWWTGVERVIVEGQYHPGQALERIAEGYPRAGNQALYYLMELDLGPLFARAMLAGSRFAGAHPTIWLELFGPWAMMLVIFVIGLAYGLVLRITLGAVARGHLVTALAGFYVFLPLLNLLTDGDLAPFSNPVFYLKVAVFLGLLAYRSSTRSINAASA